MATFDFTEKNSKNGQKIAPKILIPFIGDTVGTTGFYFTRNALLLLYIYKQLHILICESYYTTL